MKIDQTAALTLVYFLDHHFKPSRKRIPVKFGKRGGHGGWFGWNHIHLCRETEFWIVCHEYAHYLDHVTNRTDKTLGWNAHVNAKQLRHQREYHTESFYYNLRRVIEATGIDYPWNKEYRQILRWAKRDGLV